MKISEMITEEMVRGILPMSEQNCHIIAVHNIGIQLKNKDDNSLYWYDLARFLFVDAWDYFTKKKWTILDNSQDGVMAGKGQACKIFWCKDYPSRLHAMAAAVQYMWEQEKKDD